MTRTTVVPPASAGYDLIADRFDAARGAKRWEWPFFERLAEDLAPGARILDCGCGSGHLGIARLVEAGHAVTGLDGSAAMLSLFIRRYPDIPVVLADMRLFDPEAAQDAVIAWDSFFHLPQPDQAAMIERFGRWLSPGGRLLFTSGPDDRAWVAGEMFGVPFSYASFDEAGYRDRLSAAGFVSIRSGFDEPDGTVHKVWTARKRC